MESNPITHPNFRLEDLKSVMSSTIVRNLSELESFAKKFLNELRSGDVVALSGELGAGKTTLIQAMARLAGGKGSALSPTFVILKSYPINYRGIKRFCHIDLYRLNDFSQPHGFEEYLGEPGTICFIEWAEKMKDCLPLKTIWLKIEAQPDNSRLITKIPGRGRDNG